MDILSDMLRTLSFHGNERFIGRLTAPWGISFPAVENASPFYVVTKGSAVLEVPDTRTEVNLCSGDLVMLSHGDAHMLKDVSGSPEVPFSRLDVPSNEGRERRLFRLGGGGEPTILIGGSFVFDSPFARPIMDAMDAIVHVRADNEECMSVVGPVLTLFCREDQTPEPGSQAVREELMKVLFITILRYSMGEHRRRNQNCTQHPLALIFDPGLQPVVQALHLRPERSWTVAEMATQAGMSRTKFSLRFAEVSGVPPMAYLTTVRMMKAVELLQRTDATLEEIAEYTGYGSEAAFGTAFKREMGSAPGRYRKLRDTGKARDSSYRRSS